MLKALKNPNNQWAWGKIAAIVLTILLIPLIGLVYSNAMDFIKDVKADSDKGDALIVAEMKEKVDNKVLMEYLKNQKLQLTFQQKQLDKQEENRKEDKAESKEILKNLQDMNINMVIIQQQLKKE